MTPKDKANELMEKFHQAMYSTHDPNASTVYYINSAKPCALLAVDEIDRAIDFDWMEVQNLDRAHAYWNEVKKEIEQL